MDAIISFFQTIGDLFSSIIDFVLSLISDLVYIVQLTASVVAQIPNYFSWLPSSGLALIVATFAIVVIYKISGREG